VIRRPGVFYVDHPKLGAWIAGPFSFLTKGESMKKSYEYPVLLILFEKHNNEYWLAHSEKELGQIAWHILDRRVKDGWYTDFFIRRLRNCTPKNALEYLRSRWFKANSDLVRWYEYEDVVIDKPLTLTDALMPEGQPLRF
jgi:hypothetical protein